MMQLSGKMEKGLSPKDKAKKLTEKRTCRHTCQAFRHLSRAFRFQIDRFHDWISHFLSCSLSRPLFYSVSSSSSSSSIYFFFLNFCLLILIPVLQLICLMKKKSTVSGSHWKKTGGETRKNEKSSRNDRISISDSLIWKRNFFLAPQKV